MSLFNYIHVHRENQDSSILYPLKSIRSMGYIYIYRKHKKLSQADSWLNKSSSLNHLLDLERNCRKNANFSTRQTYKVITGASRLQGEVLQQDMQATVDSNLPCIDLIFLISKVLLSRTSTSFYLNWHNRDEDYRLYRRHTNLCQFPLILFIWNITTVIGYDNKEKLVRFQRKP